MRSMHLPPETEAELAALARGDLDPVRRNRLETLVAARPDLAAALADQLAALAAISAATAGVTAPATLRRLFML
jgi:DNA-binding TFAR19-related protein (PDSD5 family)